MALSITLPTAGDRPAIRARRFVQLLSGLVLYGIAISLEVRAGIGLSPWDVLAQGVSMKRTATCAIPPLRPRPGSFVGRRHPERSEGSPLGRQATQPVGGDPSSLRSSG